MKTGRGRFAIRQNPILLGSVLFWTMTGALAPALPQDLQPCEQLLRAGSASSETQALAQAIAENLPRVREFRELLTRCEQLGVRCWIFGGTAASFAHYVKQDLWNQQGRARYANRLYDYEFTSIFRSTQDADIVIDGGDEQAKLLEDFLCERFPHLQGKKSAWEVRLLSKDRGAKEALVGNPDFNNQHSDSHSTGLIEITAPTEGESRIRDLRAPGHFLEDVALGRIHYYFSERHAQTRRARQGWNPPVFSVIRILTKAFQFNLKISKKDWEAIAQVVSEFDPSTDLRTDYSSNWLEKNGKKLFHHAVDVELAWNALERLGLRRKLALATSKRGEDSLSWWMNKEPLRSRPLGEGSGMTARELGIDTVAHETRSYHAYESITLSPSGDANVFVSRPDVEGEAARQGKGFYTALGRTGARYTGLTIRFQVEPGARLGTDFLLQGNHAIFLNRKALRIIHEALDLGIVDYLKLVRDDPFFLSRDRGVAIKLKLRIAVRGERLEGAGYDDVLSMIEPEFASPTPNFDLLEEALGFALKARDPRVAGLRDRATRTYEAWIRDSIDIEPKIKSIAHAGRLGLNDRQLVSAMISALRTADENGRWSLFRAFAQTAVQLELRTPEVTSTLLRAAREQESGSQAINALIELRLLTLEFRHIIASVLLKSHFDSRKPAAAKGLAHLVLEGIEGPKFALDLLRPLLHSGSEGYVSAIVHAIELMEPAIDPQATEAIRILAHCLRHGNNATQLSAIRALRQYARRNPAATLKLLESYVSHPAKRHAAWVDAIRSIQGQYATESAEARFLADVVEQASSRPNSLWTTYAIWKAKQPFSQR